jgi:hypothetical protein
MNTLWNLSMKQLKITIEWHSFTSHILKKCIKNVPFRCSAFTWMFFSCLCLIINLLIWCWGQIIFLTSDNIKTRSYIDKKKYLYKCFKLWNPNKCSINWSSLECFRAITHYAISGHSLLFSCFHFLLVVYCSRVKNFPAFHSNFTIHKNTKLWPKSAMVLRISIKRALYLWRLPDYHKIYRGWSIGCAENWGL